MKINEHFETVCDAPGKKREDFALPRSIIDFYQI